jgi:membrane protein DedA with SNARE-associated domain
MTMQEFTESILAFIKTHEYAAAPIVFLLAFGESLALVALLVPATVILWGIGALIGATGLDFWPIYFAAVLGAGLGDWVSYWLGYHFHEQISRTWPLSRHPQLVPKAHAFFEKWGILGVFFGRFFGPLRAVVPLVAGAVQMPRLQFQLANWSSAVVWGFTTLGPGSVGFGWLAKWGFG